MPLVRPLAERNDYYIERWEDFKNHATGSNSLYWQYPFHSELEIKLLQHHFKIYDGIRSQVLEWSFKFDEYLEKDDFTKKLKALQSYIKKGMDAFVREISAYCKARADLDEESQSHASEEIEKIDVEMKRIFLAF